MFIPDCETECMLSTEEGSTPLPYPNEYMCLFEIRPPGVVDLVSIIFASDFRTLEDLDLTLEPTLIGVLLALVYGTSAYD